MLDRKHKNKKKNFKVTYQILSGILINAILNHLTLIYLALVNVTAQKINFSIKGFFSKCDQIRRKLWSHLLKKSLIKNFIFCAVCSVFTFLALIEAYI